MGQFAAVCYLWTLPPELQCSVFQCSAPLAPAVTQAGPRATQAAPLNGGLSQPWCVMVLIADDEYGVQASRPSQPPLGLKGVADTGVGSRQEFVWSLHHKEPSIMTLCTELWGEDAVESPAYRTHKRSPTRDFGAVLLEDRVCPEGGVQSQITGYLHSTFPGRSTCPAPPT